MLNEISQMEKDKCHVFTHMRNIKNKINNYTKHNRNEHRYRVMVIKGERDIEDGAMVKGGQLHSVDGNFLCIVVNTEVDVLYNVVHVKLKNK